MSSTCLQKSDPVGESLSVGTEQCYPALGLVRHTMKLVCELECIGAYAQWACDVSTEENYAYVLQQLEVLNCSMSLSVNDYQCIGWSVAATKIVISDGVRSSRLIWGGKGNTWKTLYANNDYTHNAYAKDLWESYFVWELYSFVLSLAADLSEADPLR